MTRVNIPTDRPEPGTVRGQVQRFGTTLTWEQVALDLREGEEVAAAISVALSALPFPGFRWETPPVSASTIAEPFEFVAVDSPEVARMRADASPFTDKFSSTDDDVAVFSNLGGDAVLIAPCPVDGSEGYPHLGTFLRSAPRPQVERLWRALGESLLQRLERRPDPVWVSTAGLGVAWLHLRLDDRPKYYVHRPYKRGPSE